MPPRRHSFHINSKNLFLTYPRCPISPLEAKAMLINMFPSSAHFIIAQENHEVEGEPGVTDLHLHVFAQFERQIDTYNERAYDMYQNGNVYHPNIQAPRNLKATSDYVMKGGNFISHPEGWLPTGKKQNKWDVVAALIDDGKSMEEIRIADPGFFYCNLQKIKLAFTHRMICKNQANVIGKEHLLQWRIPLELESRLSDQTKEIWTLLVSNLVQEGFGRQQLYLYGPPGIGKSTFLVKLSKLISLYPIPKTEDYYDLYQDNRYHLSFIDEFKGTKSIQWMNEWMDGNPAGMFLKVKNGQQLKCQAIPTIILSNYFPDSPDSYVNQYGSVAMQAFLRRLKVYEVTQLICHQLAEIVDQCIATYQPLQENNLPRQQSSNNVAINAMEISINPAYAIAMH